MAARQLRLPPQDRLISPFTVASFEGFFAATQKIFYFKKKKKRHFLRPMFLQDSYLTKKSRSLLCFSPCPTARPSGRRWHCRASHRWRFGGAGGLVMGGVWCLQAKTVENLGKPWYFQVFPGKLLLFLYSFLKVKLFS